MTTITDLRGIDVEHLLGVKLGPLVKIRCQGDGIVLVGQVDPASARQIAGHLLEAAARAEYESDLDRTMVAEGIDDRIRALMLGMVRRGEIERLTATHGMDPQ